MYRSGTTGAALNTKMKIEIRPELSTQNPDDVAAMAARGDYMEESLIGKDIHQVLRGIKTEGEYDPDERLQTIHERLIRRGHFGPYEHAQAFFVVEGISRTCMAQVMRHRFLSGDVQSMRYCNFEQSGMVVPQEIEGTDEQAVVEEHWNNCVTLYNDLLEQGYKKEDARFVLPVGTKVNMSFSANARTLMHFIDMRHAGDAQWEARDFAKQVLDEAEKWAPITFSTYKQYAKGSSKKAP